MVLLTTVLLTTVLENTDVHVPTSSFVLESLCSIVIKGVKMFFTKTSRDVGLVHPIK